MTDSDRMMFLEQAMQGKYVVASRSRVTGLFRLRAVTGSTKGSATVREAIDKLVASERRKALGLKA